MLRSHSPSLFILDEAVSSLQKSIRRGLVKDALFWAIQVVRGGYGGYCLGRLLLGISCEDIGFGWAGAPTFVVTKWNAWKAELKKAQCGIREVRAERVPPFTRVVVTRPGRAQRRMTCSLK